MNFDLFNHTVLLTRAGSRAYGLHTETSDLDIKGVAIPPVIFVAGIESFEQADKSSHFTDERFRNLLTKEEKEVVAKTKLEGSIYEFRKFIHLGSQANPNILDAFFCRDQDVLFSTPEGDLLRKHRDLTLSLKAKHTFTGYAHDQLERIKLHRRWLRNPPTHKPTREEHDLPHFSLLPADQLAAAEAMVKKAIDGWEPNLNILPDPAIRREVLEQFKRTTEELLAGLLTDQNMADAKFRAAVRTVGLDDNILLVMEKERKYRHALKEWQHYEEWKRKRNPDRAALEAKFGYDTKHGAHLVRLMRMAREILITGKVNVWRGDIDREELMAIRNGSWPFEQIVDFAEHEDEELTKIYEEGNSPLPHAPDREALNKVAVEMFESFQRRKK